VPGVRGVDSNRGSEHEIEPHSGHSEPISREGPYVIVDNLMAVPAKNIPMTITDEEMIVIDNLFKDGLRTEKRLPVSEALDPPAVFGFVEATIGLYCVGVPFGRTSLRDARRLNCSLGCVVRRHLGANTLKLLGKTDRRTTACDEVAVQARRFPDRLARVSRDYRLLQSRAGLILLPPRRQHILQ
jgi:hypothetical protein